MKIQNRPRLNGEQNHDCDCTLGDFKQTQEAAVLVLAWHHHFRLEQYFL